MKNILTTLFICPIDNKLDLSAIVCHLILIASGYVGFCLIYGV
jgi:hypothetical protein